MRCNFERKSLDGIWDLYLRENKDFVGDGNNPTTSEDLKTANYTHITATVPGNFELDMEKAGMLPELLNAVNILKVQELENFHLWYSVEFLNEFSDEDSYFIFQGIDTFADIYLNGNIIGSTDNMLISHEIPAKGLRSGVNNLVIHIKPAVIEARKFPLEVECGCYPKTNGESLSVRKAPHMYGWDIMPRAVSGGLWRSVELIHKPAEYIENFYIYTAGFRNNNKAVAVSSNYHLKITGDYIREYYLEIEGVCGDSHFYEKRQLWHTSGRLDFVFEKPKLWWLKNMGEQNLYDVTVKLYRNEDLIDTQNLNFGIRIVELQRTSTASKDGGEFVFCLNGEKVFMQGTNWVPLDAFHSRDRERLPKALALLDELGCNMVRCWGGNVYEEDDFFDFCDRHGIAVWQDFAMACAVYPQDERMLDAFKKEAEWVVCSYRQHASIFLWSGDNECDVAHIATQAKVNPNNNKITRKIFKDVIDRFDLMRSNCYLPSSPYYDEVAFSKFPFGDPPSEDHLWGERGYYKDPFYSECKAIFSSEIGYFGCPAPSSLSKFMSPEGIWPWENSMDWYLSAMNCDPSDNAEYKYIPSQILKQIELLFGKAPNQLEDYTIASQITQAEAMKFFVEHFRINKWKNKTGILTWNLLDGWPQTSNGFVDYYFNKKMVFETVKRVYLPICVSCDEPADGKINLIAVNDFLCEKEIEYSIIDLQCDKTVAQGKAVLSPNCSEKIAQIDYNGDKKCYKIVWKFDNEEYLNHYLAGKPFFDLQYVKDFYCKMGIYKPERFRFESL